MIILLIISLITIIILLVKNYIINCEIKNITLQLQEISKGQSNKMIDITFISATIELLAEAINENINYQEHLKTDIAFKERKLKESISNVSHDLRTPLTSIIGYIFMMKNSKKINQTEALEVIENKAKLLNELIHELYELSLIESDDYTLELEKIDVVSIITDCLVGCFNEFENKNITPDIHLPEKALYVKTNQTAIIRIIMNLLTNAIKYTTNKFYITLNHTDTDSIITISNDNNNLTQKDISQIFDRFYTADKSRKNGGTGLGLYIVKLLIEKVGGDIKQVTLENEMVTISISFPLWK